MTGELPRSLTGPIGRALVELADPEGPGEVGSLEMVAELRQLEVLSRHVFEHRLDAPFVHGLDQLGLSVPEGHREKVVENRVARMRVTAALDDIAEVLDAHDVGWVVVKGPVVAARMSHPEHRAYNDLDLLVSGAQLGRALAALIDAGAEELNQNWKAYVDHEVGEVPMRFAGVPIDLHWSLVGLGRWRRTMRLDAEAMLSRRLRTRLGGATDVSSLDDVDALLHLCVHAALSGAVRLDQLRDIAVVSSPPGLDWYQFECRARLARVGPLAAHALDRSAGILGAPVPAETLERLGGASLRIRRWIDAVGSPDRAALRGFPVVAARDGFALRWRARRELVGARLKSRISPNHTWDFADPHSVLYQDTVAGGDVARDAFIDLAK